ncbi:MAG: RimK family alpha-L-glutamate ligase [Candidatus Spechtbacterales bacterium]
MRILLLGFNQKKKSYTVKRLVVELKKRGHTVTYMSWKGLVFSFGKEVAIKRVNGTDLKYYDYIIPKAPISTGKGTREMYLSHLYRHYLLVVDYINKYHKHVLNEKTTKKMMFYDKLFQHYLLTKKGLPVVPSKLYTGYQRPSSVYKKFKMPYILKSIEGRGGKQVFLINKTRNIKERVEEFGIGKLLVQKYLPTKYDYRVMVIGNKVIGAMQRTAAEKDFRANVSLGGSAEKITPTKEMRELAIKAAKAFNAEFAGVDIIKYKNKYYILEVNIFPGFEGFERATEINVAKELVSYIEKKYLWTIDTNPSTKEKQDMLDLLYNIEKKNLEKPLTKEEFLETLSKRDLIVIKKENKPIAYLTHYKKGSTRRITRWGIMPEYRGQRMGRRMLRALITIAGQEKDVAINAVVPAGNKERQNTFKRAGFKRTERLENYFTETSEDGLVFEYKIEPLKRVKGAGLTNSMSKNSTKKETKKKKAA